ncbi:hypothetical protein CsSME_00017869 [Camellia sinensis var. sinensis]
MKKDASIIISTANVNVNVNANEIDESSRRELLPPSNFIEFDSSRREFLPPTVDLLNFEGEGDGGDGDGDGLGEQASWKLNVKNFSLAQQQQQHRHSSSNCLYFRRLFRTPRKVGGRNLQCRQNMLA